MLETSLHGLLIDCHSSDRCNEGCLWNPKGRKNNNVKGRTIALTLLMHRFTQGFQTELLICHSQYLIALASKPNGPSSIPGIRITENKNWQLQVILWLSCANLSNPTPSTHKNESINKIYLKKFLMLLKENKFLKTNTNISPLSSKFSMLPVKRKAINILQTITEII